MTRERWNTFSKREQLLFIGSELERARVWQGNDLDAFRSALARARALLDLTLEDSKWSENAFLIAVLRDEVDKFSNGSRKDSIQILYRAL